MSIKLPRAGVSGIHHPKYEFYTNKKGLKEGEAFRFETMADMFIMAALMGFYLKRPKPFEKGEKVERSIPWNVLLNNETHMQIVKSICLLHKKEDPKNANILLENEKMAKIIEEYANGGVTHLLTALEDGPDFEGNMINMIKKYRK